MLRPCEVGALNIADRWRFFKKVLVGVLQADWWFQWS